MFGRLGNEGTLGSDPEPHGSALWNKQVGQGAWAQRPWVHEEPGALEVQYWNE